ncbi:cotranscriptional regulator FAM172A homolog isoform X1 [Scleropages formosus]|uniref:cotranscriptional regulator FAM172A homolog isoform X1 n=1 Tax=Scleropages formosus TaxID=113540 RepID=UPI000878C7CE|nr:cotranscriptional regulator FAM172A homolog isoform X1 [Scleropages formosus]
MGAALSGTEVSSVVPTRLSYATPKTPPSSENKLQAALPVYGDSGSTGNRGWSVRSRRDPSLCSPTSRIDSVGTVACATWTRGSPLCSATGGEMRWGPSSGTGSWGGGSDLRGQNLLLVSPKALESQGNLMVLIQDRGTVRCGQWSWKVIAREGLERGSQIPYVRRALAEAWEVLLMNPNAGGSPEDHVSLVWNLLLSRCAAKNIAVVAHGYGGVAFVDLLSRHPQEVQRRVCAVAFVDSCHSPWHQPLGQGSRDWLKANAKKWVLSCKPLNRPVGSLKADCPQLSAGTQCHEAAPATCMDPLFRFFAKAVKAKPATVPFDIITRSKSRGRLSQGTAAAVPGKP